MPDNTEPGLAAVPAPTSARSCRTHRLAMWSVVCLAAVAALTALAAVLASSVPRGRGTRRRPPDRRFPRPAPGGG